MAGMTPRERWHALFAGEKPDRIPTDYWATGEVTRRLLAELGCADKEALYTRLHIDGVMHIDPVRTVNHFPGDSQADIWGLRRTAIQYGTGSYEEFANHPLADSSTVEELDAYPWPSPDDLDYDRFRREIAAAPRHRFIRSGEFEPFLLYCALRGMENAMMDLLVDQAFVEAALEHIFRYYYSVNERTFEVGGGLIDVT